MRKPIYASAPAQQFANHAEFYQNSMYSAFEQEHRSGGSFGLSLIDVEQPAIDMVDAPLPDFIFAFLKTHVQEAAINLGGTLKRCSKYDPCTLFVTPPDTEARVFVTEDHAIRVASLPAQHVYRLLDRVDLKPDCFHVHFADRRDLRPQPAIAAIVDKMWRVSSQTDARASLLLDGLVLQMIALTVKSEAISPFGGGRPEEVRISRVIEFVEAHLGNDLTVLELASVACLSAGHFSRTFKATTGEAVWAYVQRRRSERARDMLLATTKPIAQIAFDCGFANQAHLTRQLSARFGTTPGAIRRGN